MGERMNRRIPMDRTMAWLVLLVACVCVQNSVYGVEVDMEIVPMFQPMFVMAGTPLQITCTVKDAPNDQQVEMQVQDLDPNYNNFEVGKKVTVEKNKDVKSITISKTAMQSTDTGTYRCRVGTTEKSFSLVVFSVSSHSSNVTVGEDVTIRCEPETNFEQMDLVWLKKGKLLADIPELKGRVKYGDKNYTLTLKNAVQEDAGEYQCNITFFRGKYAEQQSTEIVKMYGKPFFSDGDKDVTVSTNVSIDITCDPEGYPKPDVTWLRDDDVIQSDSRTTIEDTGNGSRLKVTNLVMGDMGSYVCNAENSLGRKQRSFQVSIQGVISSATYIANGLSQLLLLVSVLFVTL